MKKLLSIQSELKAPKNQRNTFGNYNYRSAEDILEALKPLLLKHEATIIINDDLVVLGEHQPILYQEDVYDSKSKNMVKVNKVVSDQRFYIKSTVTFIDLETGEKVETSAFAREEENKKGMDGSQITGTASSYARKYALNGMFAIDDTKDSDGTNNHGKEDEEERKASDAQKSMISKVYGDQLEKLLEAKKLKSLDDMPLSIASEIIGKLKEKK